MKFPFYIARRYLLSKKSHHAINIISSISVFGIAIATAALVCIMSVFNGFQDMIANLFTAFDPELKVLPVKGKFIDADSDELLQLKQNPNIAVYSQVLQDNVLLISGGRQQMAIVKGVDDNFGQMVDFDRIRYGDGTFQLHADVIDYGIFGVNLLSSLGLGSDFPAPIQVYAPRGDEHIDPNDPSESFNQDELYSPHVAFCVKQNKYDANYVITSLRFAQNLFERQGKVSAIELKLKPGSSIGSVKREVARTLGDKYRVLDRYEQQEDTFKIMKIEKLISYLFLTFILLIASFNIIGSLSMLIIDKKDDITTLRNLGATDSQAARIFTIEGRLISVVGAVVGIVLGLLLCFLQWQFGIIKFGQSAGSYIIDSYPVSVQWTDIVLILLTVVAVGFLSVWFPVSQLRRQMRNRQWCIVLGMLTVMLASCGGDRNSFTINGTFTDMPAGQLYIYSAGDYAETFDTIYIKGGKFTYNGQAAELTPYILVFPNALEQVVFVKNGQTVKYKASTKDLKNYTADGNSDNKLMNKFRDATHDLSGVQVQEVARQYIMQHPHTEAAIYLFVRYFAQEPDADMSDEVAALLDQLIQAWPDKAMLQNLSNRHEALMGGNIGDKVPHVTIKTRDPSTVSIDSISDKHTVLVYWASWMPRVYDFIDNLNIIIEEYGEGRDIRFIAISLDTENYKWVNRIREDTIMCSHSCDAMAWDSPTVSKMGITDVPSYVVIDNRHTIVARGKTLDEMEKDLGKLL